MRHTDPKFTDCEILESKPFHHNNLILQLVHDTYMEIYQILIYRENFAETYDLFGLFITQADAKKKFDTISL
jgi:hypothetical protein